MKLTLISRVVKYIEEVVVVHEWVYRLSMHFSKYVCVSNAVSKCKALNLLLILNTVALTSNEA